MLELLELLHSILFGAGHRQNRHDCWDNSGHRRCARVEVPWLVWLDRASPRRFLGSKRKLFLLFPAGDMHSHQHRSLLIELAVSALRMTNDR